jgi:hypothetical protein
LLAGDAQPIGELLLGQPERHATLADRFADIPIEALPG